MDNLFKLKDGVVLEDLQNITPAMWVVLTAVIMYCKRHGLELVLTSIINDRDNVKAISKTHDTGRGLDIRIADWPEVHRQKLCFMLNNNYKDIAAISYSDRRPRCAILKSDHIHLQVRPGDIVLDKFFKE